MFEILEERRKKMLQTMLTGIFIAVLATLARDVFDYFRCQNTGCFKNGFMFPVNLSVLLLSMTLIVVSKRLPSWVSALIWQGFVLTAILFTDTPEQLIAGKSSLVWMIALLPAAFIAHPNASFLTAGAATGLVLWLADQAYGQVWPGVNIYLLAMLWIIALLAWIASRNLIEAVENAYTEQERLSAILENVADGIVVLGRDGAVLRANPVALNMLDGEIEALTKSARNAEVTVPDGRIISLSWAKVPDVGNVAVVRDVTREIEIARMKDAMLAVVSHELRTPLTGILGATQMLAASQDAAIMETGIQIIERNGARLLRLVNDLLDRAQIESGEFSLLLNPFAPDALKAELQDLLEQHSAATSLDIQFAFNADRANPILGDLGRIVQIARNLIDNAIKFTPEGEVLVQVEIEDALIMLTVTDSGVGIPPQQLPDIWQPFRRASDFDTRTTQGVGLGLSIVHALVAQMNGDLDVQSKVGEGSRFYISLPLEIA